MVRDLIQQPPEVLEKIFEYLPLKNSISLSKMSINVTKAFKCYLRTDDVSRKVKVMIAANDECRVYEVIKKETDRYKRRIATFDQIEAALQFLQGILTDRMFSRLELFLYRNQGMYCEAWRLQAFIDNFLFPAKFQMSFDNETHAQEVLKQLSFGDDLTVRIVVRYSSRYSTGFLKIKALKTAQNLSLKRIHQCNLMDINNLELKRGEIEVFFNVWDRSSAEQFCTFLKDWSCANREIQDVTFHFVPERPKKTPKKSTTEEKIVEIIEDDGLFDIPDIPIAYGQAKREKIVEMIESDGLFDIHPDMNDPTQFTVTGFGRRRITWTEDAKGRQSMRLYME